MKLTAFKKRTLAAMLLLSGLAVALILAGCESESPGTKSTEGIKTGMAEKAETAIDAKLTSTEAAATAEGVAQTATESVEVLAQKGMEQTDKLAERGTTTASELMQAGTEKAEGLASGMQDKIRTAGSEEAIEAGKRFMAEPGAEGMLPAPTKAPATALSEDRPGECFAQVKIPPKFKMVSEQVLIPETGDYRTVTKKNLVAEGRMEQRSIVCEADIKTDLVIDIQKGLAKEGFDPGPIDGIVGPFTMKALNGFQKANNLPVDQHLNLATIKALGINR